MSNTCIDSCWEVIEHRESIQLLCRYRAALDAALATEQVETVANLLEELAARSGLNAALGIVLLLCMACQSDSCQVQQHGSER